MRERTAGGLWTAALLLVLGAFAFSCTVVGAVEPWAQSVMGAAGLAALLLGLAGGRLHRASEGGRGSGGLLATEAFALAFLGFGVLQCVPLPPGLHGVLSPEAGRIFDRGLPDGDRETWRTLSVYPWATRVEVLRLAALAMVFSLLARGTRRTREARFAVAGFVAVGAVAAALGILDAGSEGGMVGHYPRERVFTDRLAGVLVNPNHFAGMMEMTALAALGACFALSTQDAHGGGRGLLAGAAAGLREGTNRPGAVALLLAFLLSTAALLLTGSRLGSFSFLAGLGTLAFLLTRSRRPGWLLAGLVGTTAAVLLASALAAADPVLSRWSLLFDGGESAAGRIRAWRAVGAMGARFPGIGSGLGTFGHLFPAYQPVGLQGTWDHAHNELLQLFADTGAAGVLCALGFLASWVAETGRVAIRGPMRRRGLAAGCLAATAAILVHGTGDFNLQIPSNAWLLAGLMGVGQALAAFPGAGKAARASGGEGGSPPGRPHSV